MYSCMNEDDSAVCAYRNTTLLFVYFLAGNILLASPLRMSPIFDLSDVWILTQNAAIASGRAINLAIYPLKPRTHAIAYESQD